MRDVAKTAAISAVVTLVVIAIVIRFDVPLLNPRAPSAPTVQPAP